MDQHSLVLYLSGKGSKSQHKQIIIFAIKRSEVGRKTDSSDSHQYKAGMGVMISLPNERHPSTRIFRIGLSRIKLDYRSNSVHELLLQKVDEFHRVEVDSKADQGWVDIIQKTIHEQIKAAKWS